MFSYVTLYDWSFAVHDRYERECDSFYRRVLQNSVKEENTRTTSFFLNQSVYDLSLNRSDYWVQCQGPKDEQTVEEMETHTWLTIFLVISAMTMQLDEKEKQFAQQLIDEGEDYLGKFKPPTRDLHDAMILLFKLDRLEVTKSATLRKPPRHKKASSKNYTASVRVLCFTSH